ncbi:hypothetical protein ACN47E_008546 [Coniothyrium glycines]
MKVHQRVMLLVITVVAAASLANAEHNQPVKEILQERTDPVVAVLGDEDIITRQSPSPQEIAASMNTLWDPWDEEHCKNVCEISWHACQLRRCHEYHEDIGRKQEL